MVKSTNLEILIISYFFLPEKTPRAYRTFELVKEFSKRGYKVTLIIPKYEDIQHPMYKEFDIINVESGFLFNKSSKLFPAKDTIMTKEEKSRTSLFKKFFSKIYYFFYLGGDSFEFCIPAFKAIKKINKEFDLCISIGLPISVHISAWLGLKFGKLRSRVSVADYGDPFSYASKYNLHRIFERYMLKSFDYISVPTKHALPAYESLVENSKLHVIPQGFDFSDIVISEYKKRNIPFFSYAGVFYDEIRDPTEFFEYLSLLNIDFRFVIYTRLNHSFSVKLLNKYKLLLGDKLVVLEAINRLDLIFELSKMDFLINFENTTTTQSPSKLIDYKLARRPVLNIKSGEGLNINRIQDFLVGKSNKSDINIELSLYNIKTICDKFLSLH